MDQQRSGPAERHHRPEPSTGGQQPPPVDVPSAPYLRRPGDGPLPNGWRAEPLRGGWNGQDTEVVYDPRRHEIAFTWHSQRTRQRVIDVIYNHRDQEALLIPHDENTDPADLMTALGWEQRAIDGQRSFWTGDRHAAVEAALRRIDQPAATTPTGQQHESPQAIATKPTGGDLTL